MAAELFHLPFNPVFTTNGLPAPGAELFFYVSGTFTPAPIYTDGGLSIEHENPVEANGAGRIPTIYLDGDVTYRLVIKTRTGSILDDIDPFIPGQVLKGDPGGDASQVGTFAAAQLMTIAASIKVIRLTDRGLALFERTATEPAHAGKLRSADRFLPDGTTSAGNGGWWKLSSAQTITPKMFGASGWTTGISDWHPVLRRYQVAYGCPDDGAALNAWALACQLYGYSGRADGLFGTTVEIAIGSLTTDYRTAGSLGGDLTIIGLGAMSRLVAFYNFTEQVWHGRIRAVGIGTSHNWASRTIGTGVGFEGQNSNMVITGGVEAHGFSVLGVDGKTNQVGEFVSFVTIPTIRGYHCGSGLCQGNPALGTAQTATYSNRVRTGDSFDTNQRDRLDVTTLPPPGPGHTRVIIGGKTYQVKTVDTVNSRITLYPWIATADLASTGTLYYLYGGLFEDGGADGSLWNVGEIAASVCSIAYSVQAAYPIPNVHVTAQDCCVGLLFRDEASEQFGARIGLYDEANQFSMIIPNAGLNHNLIDMGPTTYGLSTLELPIRWDGANNLIVSMGLGSIDLRVNGRRIASSRKFANNEMVIALASYLGGNNFMFYNNSGDIYTVGLSPDAYRLEGAYHALVTVVGTGADGQPTGTITFHPPAGRTVNGGAVDAAITFSGLTKPLQFAVVVDPGTFNVIAKRVN